MKSVQLVSLTVLIILVILFASACSKQTFLLEKDTEDMIEVPSTTVNTIQVVKFPANEGGKTEFSTDIFAITFSLAVSMPAGITIDINKSLYPDGISGTFSNIPILDPNGNNVGCVGYNVFDAEQLHDNKNSEAEPMMIYNQISLGNHYRFTIREKYEIVNDTDALTTAITDVYNDLELPPEKNYTESEYNYGVVAFSKTLGVYVALDLDKNFFTQNQCEEIAESIIITHDSSDAN
jgi:hypothetical protein